MRLGLDRQAGRRLAAMLAAGLGLAAWLAYEGGGLSVPPVNAGETAGQPDERRPAQRPEDREAKPLRLDLAKLERPRTREVSAELFGPAQEPAPPPPAVAVQAAPPPPPEPPKLPFQFLGRMTDRGEPRIFLGQGQETHTVKAGATLGGTWRVDSIAADAVVFTFLPMNAQQTLAIAPPP